MGDEPMKLQLMKNSNGVLSTELVGVHDDMQTFSYAYKFTTNQAGFLVRRYDVFDAVRECGWLCWDDWDVPCVGVGVHARAPCSNLCAAICLIISCM